MRSIVTAYDYRDEGGTVLYQCVRFAPKDFRQRRPDGAGWKWNLQGVRLVPYRLPDVLADDQDRPVYLVEGEKDADALWTRGHVATCNPMGAGKWHHVADVAKTTLEGREVIVVADNDAQGRKHARDVAASLRGVARSVRVTRCPAAKDVSDTLPPGRAGRARGARRRRTDRGRGARRGGRPAGVHRRPIADVVAALSRSAAVVRLPPGSRRSTSACAGACRRNGLSWWVERPG